MVLEAIKMDSKDIVSILNCEEIAPDIIFGDQNRSLLIEAAEQGSTTALEVRC